MSLLVINSSSRVARGLVKGFVNAGNHQKVICADLLPNYKAIERYISLRAEVSKPGVLETAKITGKSSLESLIERADQVVYVTHDYYQNVPSKTSMFENVMNIMNQQSFKDKRIVFVTPSEYDHCEEAEPSYANILNGAACKFSHLRLDLTFDEDSQIVHNTILRRISSGSSLYFKQSTPKASRNPVKVSDVLRAVQHGLEGRGDGHSFFLQGEKGYSYEELISVLEAAADRKAELNKCTKENIIPPTCFGPISDILYTQCYINSQGIIHSTRTGKDVSSTLRDGKEILGSKQMLEEFYKPGGFTDMKAHEHTFLKKFLLY